MWFVGRAPIIKTKIKKNINCPKCRMLNVLYINAFFLFFDIFSVQFLFFESTIFYFFLNKRLFFISNTFSFSLSHYSHVDATTLFRTRIYIQSHIYSLYTSKKTFIKYLHAHICQFLFYIQRHACSHINYPQSQLIWTTCVRWIQYKYLPQRFMSSILCDITACT